MGSSSCSRPRGSGDTALVPVSAVISRALSNGPHGPEWQLLDALRMIVAPPIDHARRMKLTL
jgi:hypothetical protein